jgi:hypothetical protein
MHDGKFSTNATYCFIATQFSQYELRGGVMLMKKSRRMICLLVLVIGVLFAGCSVPDMIDGIGDIGQTGSADEPYTGQIQTISEEKYAYQQLDAQTQKVYDEMLQTIRSFDEKITISTTDEDVMRKAYKAMVSDYGDLFWVSGYTYTRYTRGDDNIRLEFVPSYTMGAKQKKQYQEQVDAAVDDFLCGVSADDSDFKKIRYVFETLIKRVEYDQDAPENQNILSVFLYGRTVCQGYAAATQYLLNKLNIPCTIITGQAQGGPHAWNLVYADGDYYYVDTTWGNSAYSSGTDETSSFVDYAYLCMTQDEIGLTHTPDVDFDLPECTATKDNYYIRKGLYFDTFDKEKIGKKFAKGYEKGRDVSVKLSDEALYEQAVQYFIRDKNIRTYCPGIDSVYYVEEKELHILTIRF